MTKQKALLLSILKKTGRHMTASELLCAAREVMPRIARGTVYRNLALLSETGEIGRVALDGHADRFEARTKKHDHMVCEICGCLRDFLIPGIPDAVTYETGERVTRYTLFVYHVCAACRLRVGGEGVRATAKAERFENFFEDV